MLFDGRLAGLHQQADPQPQEPALAPASQGAALPSGAAAPMPAVSQSDTAEIQPARTVSEDSDSEGATLFQPVEFREHVQVRQVMCCSTATCACMAFVELAVYILYSSMAAASF